MTRRVLLTVALLLTLAGSALAPAASATPVQADVAQAQASARVATRDVTFFQLGYGDGIKRPLRVFTTVNSGPFYKKLTWRNWDTAHAVARGVYVSNCASCGGPAYRKAVLHFEGFRSCGGGVTVYRTAYGVIRQPDGTTERTREPVVCPNGS